MITSLFFELYRNIALFFEYYFIRQTTVLWRFFFEQFAHLNRVFGITANMKHFFEPLYRDYSFGGYIFAIPWRACLIVAGLISSICLFVLFLSMWIFWVGLPFFISYFLFSAA